MEAGIEVIDLWAKRRDERGMHWQFRVWDRRRRNWKSKSFAEGEKDKGWLWAEEQRALLTMGMTTTGRVSFALVAQEYVQLRRERGLNELYCEEIERVAGAVVKAGAVDLNDAGFEKTVTDWLAKAPSFAEGKQPPGPVTKNRWLVELKSICKYAVTKRWVGAHPLIAVRPFKQDDTIKTTLRLEEMRAMVAEWKRIDRYFLPGCFLVYAGVRIGEAMHMRWEWLDLEARTIEVRVLRDKRGQVVWAPKRNKERVIPMQQELHDILAAVADRPAAGWVVDDQVLRELEDKNQWKAFRAYLVRCGLDARDLSPHCTRHTWTAVMLATGASPSAVRRALGHESLATTDGYAEAEAKYSSAVKGWERGEFRLRKRAAAPAARKPADALAGLRAHLAAGGAIADVAALEQLLATG